MTTFTTYLNPLLGLVAAWAPRDRLEAALVLQIPPLLLAARAAEAAGVEADCDRRMRLERHGMTLQRRAEALSEEVLTPVKVVVLAGFGGAAAVGPDGVLEARDEFEAEPLPAFKGVPKWKKAGRKYLDELTEAEFAELIEVQMRGQRIEEPPQRGEGYVEP